MMRRELDFKIYRSPQRIKMPEKESAVLHKADNTIPREPSVVQELLALVAKIVSMGVAILLIFTFLFGIMRYSDPSMDPSIKDGDLVLFYRYKASGYVSRDVVVINKNGKQTTGRVVAVEGDTVDVTEEGLVINGALQQEEGIFKKTERYVEGVDFPLTVPDGHVFILGDSREGAEDSRIYGPVSVNDTMGKVMAVIRRRGI